MRTDVVFLGHGSSNNAYDVVDLIKGRARMKQRLLRALAKKRVIATVEFSGDDQALFRQID